MSFLRHGEIYRPMQKRERPAHDRPQPHRYDEFPAGYSLAGCAPAEPASPSPAITHSAGNALGSTIKMQRTANHLLTACLTQGDNPSLKLLLKAIEFIRHQNSDILTEVVPFGLVRVLYSLFCRLPVVSLSLVKILFSFFCCPPVSLDSSINEISNGQAHLHHWPYCANRYPYNDDQFLRHLALF